LAYGQQEFWRSTTVDEEGRFEFPGLAPGKAKLRAQAPGLVSEELDVTIGGDDRVELRLAKPSSLILDLGEEGAGGTLWIMRSGTWKPSSDMYSLFRASTPASPEGRAIFSSLAPGTYDAVFSNRVPSSVYAGGQTSLQLIGQPVKVAEGGSPATAKLTWKAGTATVKFVPELAGVDADDALTTQAALLLRSERAFSLIRVGRYSTVARAKPWFVRGTPPKGFPKMESSEGVTVTGLPAGEYELLTGDLRRIGVTARSSISRNQSGGETKLLKTFTLKDGETLDLGSIEIDPVDKSVPEKKVSGAEIGEDKPLQ
jgi:hypothetical protein